MYFGLGYFLLELKKTSSKEIRATHVHRLKKSKPHQNQAQHKNSIRKSGLVFEETSKEDIKSTLDRSLGVLGPWKQNAGDLYMGCFTPKGQKGGGLLNQPLHPVMRINGYPVNPKGSKSLSQMLDGRLQEEDDIREILAQLKGPVGIGNSRMTGYRPGGMNFGGRIPNTMNVPSRGMTSQGMMGNTMGNINEGYKRMKAIQPKRNSIFLTWFVI